jgi:hypothetical protein
MGLTPLKTVFNIILNWLWLAISFKPPELFELYADQELLFRGSVCRLYWKVGNAYLIKLYINEVYVGNFLPEESLIIPLKSSIVVNIKIYGVYRNFEHSIKLRVNNLFYRDASQLALKRSFLIHPPLIRDIVMKFQYPQAMQLSPALKLNEITLDTPYARQLEIELQERIELHQRNLSTTL